LTIPQRELRNEYRRVLREVEAGAEVTITDRGRPVARLVPIEDRRTFVPWNEVVAAFQNLPSIDYEEFMADVRPPDSERIGDLPDPWEKSSSTRAR
jgi:prevent-host-death family protein